MANGSQAARQNDPNYILNECREIDRGIDNIKGSLSTLASLQQRSLDDPDSSVQSSTNRQLDAVSSETMTMYRSYAARIKALKQMPESSSAMNSQQVGRVDRKLKTAIQEYQSMDSAFRKKLQEQMARQYRIVRPEASEQEVRDAVEDTSNQQVFSQALLQSDRRGQSRAALSAVENRHAAIQKIESQMIELAELFQDMEALVVQQEAAVTNIETKGEEVVENLDKGTQQINTAINSAKNARKWKWWCLGICSMSLSLPLYTYVLTHQVLIIIIIVVVVLIYKFVIQTPAKTKRWVVDAAPVARSLPAADVEKRYVVPGLTWTPENTLASSEPRHIVIPGKEWAPEDPPTAKRALSFVA
jgi:syntaxin 1B/2/3